jgi:hypothetical protein
MAALAQGEESAPRNVIYQPPRQPLRTKQAISGLLVHLSEVIDDENPKRLVFALADIAKAARALPRSPVRPRVAAVPRHSLARPAADD